MTDQLVRLRTHEVMILPNHVIMRHLSQAEQLAQEQQDREYQHDGSCWTEEPRGARHRDHRA